VTKKRYETCCVSANGDDITNMVDEAREIKYDTFMKHVDKEEVMNLLGYPCGNLRLKNDWCVRYYKSKYQGKPCVYVNHSAIEYVFV